MIQTPLAIICILLSISTCAAQSAESLKDESPRIAVSLTLPKSTFAVGESIPAKIEISNTGDVPVLIANQIFMSTTTYPSHIEFEMKDDRRHAIPATLLSLDSFGQEVESSPGIALLKWLQLLSPGYSLTKVFMLDKRLFRTLSKPGQYTLSASYSSNSLIYPPLRDKIGLTEADVKSIPFEAWTGKTRTNEVSFRIISSRK
jgi:hypothetical protein